MKSFEFCMTRPPTSHFPWSVCYGLLPFSVNINFMIVSHQDSTNGGASSPPKMTRKYCLLERNCITLFQSHNPPLIWPRKRKRRPYKKKRPIKRNCIERRIKEEKEREIVIFPLCVMSTFRFIDDYKAQLTKAKIFQSDDWLVLAANWFDKLLLRK